MPRTRSVLKLSASDQEYGDDDREFFSKKQWLLFEPESIFFFSFKLKLIRRSRIFELKELRTKQKQQRKRRRKFTRQREKEIRSSWVG